MRFLLDTNVVIGLLRHHRGIMARIRHHPQSDCALSAVVVHELYFGAYKSQRQADSLEAVERLPFAIIPFDKEDARQAAEIRTALAAAGAPIGPLDLLIAGQARARGLVVVTRNTREFSRVPGLEVEGWEA